MFNARHFLTGENGEFGKALLAHCAMEFLT